MPIYAYRCAHCGHTKDVLQKISDTPLTSCPACGQETFSKQITAAGFQLKGSGWYVTDFRGGSGGSETSSTSVGGETAVSTSTSATESTTSAASSSASCAPGCGCH
ncbi:hypothetical protein GCM10009007_14300 [Formosimonas limnophila]|uniref:Putative regulatory protein FmdB zinc ribbon domain-containing protein n=1 Tax=Formosimonas limnophila TaxID=1384487 RepID=A0A8J3CL45_9BURK|nr:FmdB family zinc ribbon protein [Formosimonas limnophila]GHA74442.1 hypothetical protein GCM10009007_14300 [Formosimonas limnophila]